MAAGDLRLESDSRNTPGTWKERLSWVRKCRFAFEAIPDLPEMTGALRKIDRIRKRGNPGCDAT